ncbi:MAG: hypothetical protein AB7F28_08910 [Candidatus Margulisiibacteriota bacterium]
MTLQTWLQNWANKEDNPQAVLQDIVQQGCCSGSVGELIYYPDIFRFYDRFGDDIWDLVTTFRDQTGLTLAEFLGCFKRLDTETDLKTNLVWFAVEETAAQLLATEGLL